MHLILMTRGIYQSQQIWETFMQAQWFKFRQKPILKDKQGNFLKNADGTYQHGNELEGVRVQGSLRPIQLWEYVFPQESLQEVLAMMNIHKGYNNLRPEVNKIAWLLRKGTGAEKIPDMPDLKTKEAYQVTDKLVPTQGLAVYPIGIRKDDTHDYIFGDIGMYQEGL